jgi:signal peptidase I
MRLASADAAAVFVSDLLMREGTAWVRAVSGSMAPLILPGDRLRLALADPATLRPGDVVVYGRRRELVVHRVVARSGDGVVTKGDALPGRDAWLSGAAVLGRVVALSCVGGRVHDLSALRWSLVGRLVAWLSRLGERCAAPPHRWWRRLGWGALRLPVHVCAWLLR